MPVHPSRADPAITALLEAARRAGRGGARRTVLLLHLNAIAAPRPHHGRIARAILNGVAQRLEGEVLRLQSGDLALLCRHRDQPDPTGPDAAGPEGLPAILTRLFGAVTPAEGHLFSIFQLPHDAIMMHARLLQPFVPPEPPAPELEATALDASERDLQAGDIPFGAAPASAAPNPLNMVAPLLDFAAMPELMHRQTAIRLRPGDPSRALRPIFREITFSIDALERRIAAAAGQVRADPFVFRHLTTRFDARMLAALARQIEHGGPLVALDASCAPNAPANPPASIPTLHINLALTGILSPAFDHLVAVARARQVALGIELSYVEACADPHAFASAHDRIRIGGMALILDGVSANAIQLTRPAALGADLLKLEWVPSLPRLAGLSRGRLQEGLHAIGVDRIVLQHAETEAALAWGLACGITQFQGRHVDAMLAAQRLLLCAHASACTLRQCMDRAAALGAIGRAGCHAPTLLDSLPQEKPASPMASPRASPRTSPSAPPLAPTMPPPALSAVTGR